MSKQPAVISSLKCVHVKIHVQVFDGDKKGEQPGGEELSLLVTILRSKAAHPSVAAAGKCVVLRNCLEHIQTLSSR